MTTFACSSRHVVDPPVPTAAVADGPSVAVAPRWEEVARFAGTGSDRTGSFNVAGHALQWRVSASCSAGRLRVHVDGEGVPIVDEACPGRSFGFSIRTGGVGLVVTASDAWTAVVEQQVDTPISEPPLAGMEESTIVGQGSFYGIDQEGTGTVTLHRLPDGRLALRFESFRVTANEDLFVWVSEADRPKSSEDAFRLPHVQIERLKATAGPQNYVLPEGLAPDAVHSIVVWCEPVRTAYAGAQLVFR